MDLLSSRMTCRIKWGGENDLKESDKSQIVVLHSPGAEHPQMGEFPVCERGFKDGNRQPRLRRRAASDVTSGMIWESLVNNAIVYVCTLIHQPAVEPR